MATTDAFTPEPRFPFSAIVAQERMKRALLLNAVNPRIGGALIRGNKGTAKSTAVRALAGVLPVLAVVRGCPFSCSPGEELAMCTHCSERDEPLETLGRPVRIVDLPVGASEERVVGSLDIERALSTGEQAFEPGILAAAHRGIVYVDEVNLLSDHLVDVLLDSAAMGRNYVERDGLSLSHPSSFILVGTMNPEEGELRPQLLDRFGLMVEADSGFSTEDRIEVVKRRVAFESDPAAFIEGWRAQEERLRSRISMAQDGLAQVTVPDEMHEAIAHICREHGVDGLRADIVIHRAASTIAAWDGRSEVTLDDVAEASQLAIAHRLRRMPFDEPRLDPQRLGEMLEDFERSQGERGEQSTEPHEAEAPGVDTDEERPWGYEGDGEGAQRTDQGHDEPRADERSAIGAPVPVDPPQPPRQDDRPRNGTGRQTRTLSASPRGRHVGARLPEGDLSDLDVGATLVAAAPQQHHRGASTLEVRPSDVRVKQRETRASALVVFVLDASGSMGARRRMEATKGAVLSLLMNAYQSRDRVALISVRGAGATVAVPPTRSVELAHRRLAALPTGGRTPLWAGFDRAAELVTAARRSEANVIPLLVVVTDGRANAPRASVGAAEATIESARAFGSLGVRALVIDTEEGYVKLGLARSLATELNADYVTLDHPDEAALTDLVRQATRGLRDG